jgi:uncharacterized protein
MRIGVVSDTHGHTANTREAIQMLESLDVETVLHCGDIGTPEIVELFSAWPTHFVFGNCDGNRDALRAAITAAGQHCHDEFGDLELAGVRVALLHSHDREQFRTAIQSGKWQLVCYGHTHVASIDNHGNATVLNPGAIYRANPHSIAVVELPQIEATIVTI